MTSSAELRQKLDVLRRQNGRAEVDAWFPDALGHASDLAHQYHVAMDQMIAEGAGGIAFPGCLRGGQRVVVKVPFPATDRDQIGVMELFAGQGAPAVLGINGERTAYVMEFVEADPRRVATAVEVQTLAHLLHRRAPSGFPDLRGWVASRAARAWEHRYRHGADAGDYHAALELAEHLVATTAKPVLLHGDLHAENIIRTATGLVAIDPATVQGDPASDIAFYLAWRGHQLPLLPEWESVSNPRVDAWTWVFSVFENWYEDESAAGRRQLISHLAPRVL